jgi:prepilin-type N-terminal cleavage/methylation domain-containing protein
MSPEHFSRINARARRGTTLVEVIAVTIIIGILASLTMPSFHRALEQARADVAGANLRAIWSAQRLYWLENRAYAPDLATLYSFDLLDPTVSTQNFYTYEISYSDTATFTALATRAANGGWNGTLSVDQTGLVSGALSAAGQPDIVPTF